MDEIEKLLRMPQFIGIFTQVVTRLMDEDTRGNPGQRCLLQKYVREVEPECLSESQEKAGWNCARDFACRQCVAILRHPSERIVEALSAMKSGIRQGFYVPTDLAQMLAQVVINEFFDSLWAIYADDSERDEDYRELREAITRIAHDGQNVFQTIVRKSGKRCGTCWFAPAGVDAKECKFKLEDIDTPPPELGDVNPAIRKEGKGTRRNSRVWDRGIVEQEAKRFWTGFINSRNKGIPCYVPIYAMYCWCSKSFPLGRVCIDSLDDPVVFSDSVKGSGRNYVSKTAPEDKEDNTYMSDVENRAFAQCELPVLVNEFVNVLTPDQRFLMSWMAESDGRQREAAMLMDRSDAAISRMLESIKNKLVEFLATHDGLFDSGDISDLFIEKVELECKKSSPPPIRK